MSPRRPRILLVDDDADDAELTRLAFAEMSPAPDLLIAGDGVEALSLLHGTLGQVSHAPAPNLILLDLNLPLIDGHEVLRRLRAAECTRWLPILVMTSSTDERDISESYRLGANGYLQKPIGYPELVRAARAICQYWLGLNLAPECEVPHGK